LQDHFRLPVGRIHRAQGITSECCGID